MTNNPNSNPDFITIFGGINDLGFDTAPIGEITDKTNATLMGCVYLLMMKIESYFPTTIYGIMSPLAEIHYPNIDSSPTLRYRFNFTNPLTLVTVGDTYNTLGISEGTYTFTVSEIHLTGGVGYIYCTCPTRNCPKISGTMTRITGGGDASLVYSSSSNNGVNLFVNKLRDFCIYYNVPFLDLYNNTGLRPWDPVFNDLYFKYGKGVAHGDGLHPNYLGHEWIYPRIREFVKKFF